MYCPFCQSQIPDEAAFCPRCGKSLSASAEDETLIAHHSESPSAGDETVSDHNHTIDNHSPAGGQNYGPSNGPAGGQNYRPNYGPANGQNYDPNNGQNYEPNNGTVDGQNYGPNNGTAGGQYYGPNNEQNPYKPLNPPPPPPKSKLPIILALLTLLAATAVICVIVFLPTGNPGPVSDSTTSSDTSSGNTDSEEIAYTPTPTATPTPTPTPEPTPTPTPTPAPASSSGTAPSSGSMISLPGGGQAPASDFIFPNSSSELLSSSDLNSYLSSAFDAQIAINEIYARYGYTFTTDSVTANATRDKFESKDWYIQAQKTCPTSNRETFAESYMNSVERANLETLLAWKELH